MKKREKLLVIIPAVLVVGVVLTLLLLAKKEMQYTFHEKAFQTFAGAVSEIPAGTELKLSKDGTEILASHETAAVEISDVPVYFTGETKKILEPGETIYYEPRGGSYVRSDFFTEYEEVKGVIHARNGERERSLSGGFVFDGKDTFLFLENMKLTVNRHTYELPMFSFVYALYGSALIIYDYGTGEYVFETPETEANASPLNGDYTISLLNDVLTRTSGRRELLFSEPKKLDSMFD